MSETSESKVKTELAGWESIEWRYGLCRFVREDGANISPRMTPGGNIQWNAWHPKHGLACTFRGNPKPFSSARVAEKWILAADAK